MQSLRSAACAGLLLAVPLLAGCEAASDSVGFSLPTLSADAAVATLADAGADASEMVGELRVLENGCLTWSGDEADGAWIVWPHDVRAGSDGNGVELPTGRTFTDGAGMQLTGALVALEDLPDGDNPDSYFGSFGGFCDADKRGVLVLTEANDFG